MNCDTLMSKLPGRLGSTTFLSEWDTALRGMISRKDSRYACRLAKERLVNHRVSIKTMSADMLRLMKI